MRFTSTLTVLWGFAIACRAYTPAYPQETLDFEREFFRRLHGDTPAAIMCEIGAKMAHTTRFDSLKPENLACLNYCMHAQGDPTHFCGDIRCNCVPINSLVSYVACMNMRCHDPDKLIGRDHPVYKLAYKDDDSRIPYSKPEKGPLPTTSLSKAQIEAVYKRHAKRTVEEWDHWLQMDEAGELELEYNGEVPQLLYDLANDYDEADDPMVTNEKYTTHGEL